MTELHFKTWDGMHYLCAENGGGSTLNATRVAAAQWETFTVQPPDGGTVSCGRPVRLRTDDGRHYVCAENGGGGEINATRTDPREWETFYINRLDGGSELAPGAKATLRTYNGRFVCAENGGGGPVVANRAVAAQWETFTLEAARVHEAVPATGYSFTRAPLERAGSPIVVLIGGSCSNEYDMVDPRLAAEGHVFPYDYHTPLGVENVGSGAYPRFGPWSLEPSADAQLNTLTGWGPALNARGYSTIHYRQGAPDLTMAAGDLKQLSEILIHAMSNPDLAHEGSHPVSGNGRRFILVGHSRGGILARAALVGAAQQRLFDTNRVIMICTLHSPNQGSNLANIAIAVDSLAKAVTGGGRHVPDVLARFQRWVAKETTSECRKDYSVAMTTTGGLPRPGGCEVLEQLALHEPVDKVRYLTFGGTSATLRRYWLRTYTPDSAVLIPVPFPHFRWRTQVVASTGLLQPFLSRDLPAAGAGVSSLISALFGLPPTPIVIPVPLPPELQPGLGDLLVTDVAARLPMNSAQYVGHRSNDLNHSEALFHPSIQAQLISYLDRTTEERGYVAPEISANGHHGETPIVGGVTKDYTVVHER